MSSVGEKILSEQESETVFSSLTAEEKTAWLVLGGDENAIKKIKAIETLSPGAEITVMSPEIDLSIHALFHAGTHISIVQARVSEQDIEKFNMVVFAGRDKKTLHLLERLSKKNIVFSIGQDFYQVSTNNQTAEERTNKFHERRWKKAATWILFAFSFMIIGHILLSYVPAGDVWQSVTGVFNHLDASFKWLLLTGFCAQLIDGLLGMGYGLTCTTVLLSMGIQLPAISGSIHTAEMFSSGISGYSHYRFGNINKKLFYALLIPGITGAVIGAVLLSVYGEKYGEYIRPFLAVYTLLLGVRVLSKAFRKKREKKKTKHVSVLAGAGGFLDSFGGGGWGPLVTSTLISGGRTPKYVIGSVSATEFFVTLASALTFFTILGLGHWQVIAGLVIGGTLAAPIAARLSGKLPVRYMFIGVGALAVIWSLRILVKSLAG